MGHLLRSTLRESDLPGRYGGDEFMAVLPDTDDAGALRVGDRLMAQLQEAAISWNGATLPVRGSVGIATLAAPVRMAHGCAAPPKGYFEETLRMLLEAADVALYAAKRGGRGRLQIATQFSWPAVAGAREEP